MSNNTPDFAKAMYVAEVFKKLTSNYEKQVVAKVAAGLEDRRKIKESLTRGVVPVTPRTLWMSKTAKSIIDHAVVEARTWNSENPTSRLTTADLRDALRGALVVFATAAGLDPAGEDE